MLTLAFCREALASIGDAGAGRAAVAAARSAPGFAGDAGVNAAAVARSRRHRLERRCAPTSRCSTREVHGKPLVYLDSANTSQKPRQVIDAVDAFYREHNANISRAVHTLGMEATEAYEAARGKLAALPQRARRRTGADLRHHHGDQPGRLQPCAADAAGRATRSCSRAWSTTPTSCPGSWSAQRSGAQIRVAEHHAGRRARPRRAVEADDAGREDPRLHPRLERARHRQSGRARSAARRAGAASSPWSMARRRCRIARVDITAIGCDFYAFTGHKMLGPTGTGGAVGATRTPAVDAALPRRRRDDPRSAASRTPPSTTRRTSSKPARRTSPA